MDLNDLFGELDDDAEAEELGLFGLTLPTARLRASISRAKKLSVRPRGRITRHKTRKGGSFSSIMRRAASASRKAKARGRSSRRRPSRLKLRALKMRMPTAMRVKRSLPLPVSQPAAYRHLCANAGMGGSSALQVLTNIQGMVKAAEVRALATSEHHVLNNTQAFRAAVLKRLTAQLKRGKRRRGRK